MCPRWPWGFSRSRCCPSWPRRCLRDLPNRRPSASIPWRPRRIFRRGARCTPGVWAQGRAGPSMPRTWCNTLLWSGGPCCWRRRPCWLLRWRSFRSPRGRAPCARSIRGRRRRLRRISRARSHNRGGPNRAGMLRRRLCSRAPAPSIRGGCCRLSRAGRSVLDPPRLSNREV